MSAAIVLSLAMGVSSCSYNQFAGVATGSSLGGMLGSSIGGLMGGPRGADRGTLAGMIIGGAVGAAATAPHTPKADTQNDSYAYGNDTPSSGNEVQYGTYNNPRYKSAAAAHSDLQSLEVSNIHFLDDNNNQRLDADEQACIVFDIYNRGSRTLYNVAPKHCVQQQACRHLASRHRGQRAAGAGHTLQGRHCGSPSPEGAAIALHHQFWHGQTSRCGQGI